MRHPNGLQVRARDTRTEHKQEYEPGARIIATRRKQNRAALPANILFHATSTPRLYLMTDPLA
eukprot:scaffold362079_cov29-Prasinocladus_malaysianus.AAC.1